MPMIPKPMTDINSESAYEKLKFIPEHYNEIMAAYTDIMEHLRLPIMNDTGEGGSGEECLHEVVEVTNPCPAYTSPSTRLAIASALVLLFFSAPSNVNTIFFIITSYLFLL